MKKGRSKSISVVTTQGSEGQKRKYPYNTASNEKQYMSRSRILVSRVMTRMCLLLLMAPRMRVLRENATIATSLCIRRQIAES